MMDAPERLISGIHLILSQKMAEKCL